MSTSHKLLFIGEPGAGKTTCIAALSEIPPVSTDVPCTDELALRKETTTVAFDYGELSLSGEDRLLLYGLPGQARFKFMFDVVRDGLLGVVILVDASADGALGGLRQTLETYADDVRELPAVVALNKSDAPPAALIRESIELLTHFGLVAPILSIDARRRSDIVKVFEALFVLLEGDMSADAAQEHSPWH